MEILLTHHRLERRAGTELVTRELALALLKRGHKPICYSPVLGDVARDIRNLSIPVIDNLAALGKPPDIIHGQHHLPAMEALLYFPDTPGVFVCHGWMPWQEAIPPHPRWLRYVGVDDLCYDRVRYEAGIHPDRIHLMLNWADLERFSQRPPLPAKPKRALLYSNYVKEGEPLEVALREVCARENIQLDVMGLASGRVVAQPETVLPQYDLVFAIAKSALESVCVGNSVLLCSQDGCGPLVTTENVAALRRSNLGRRALTVPISADYLHSQVKLYNAQDATEVCRRVRREASLEHATDNYIALYEEVVAEFNTLNRDADVLLSESRAVAAYLKWLSPRLQQQPPLWKPFKPGNLWLERAQRIWRRAAKRIRQR